ncbi:uncharacterized protein LOC119361495 [Triticum dicoccoides]|uniref:uncharacterized protein LOC119361495 n=1 Tax=Triticum dicoccoides TaxID=85692 RepID=UPI00188F08FB|nr:uncharacterized protein LOC119361495 [Triticum dicoccoides]
MLGKQLYLYIFFSEITFLLRSLLEAQQITCWNEWAVQSLVLFSFTLQVFLLMFASIRRYSVSTGTRLLLWLAYLLADTTALFTLGHLSISTKLPERHRLLAFWAPFLLVHLGGQDNITAYSFEDNGLWLRHLQTLVVQVLGAAYVLYKYMPVSGETWELTMAAILIFVVGVLKYGERIWALRSATFDSIWSSVDEDSSAALSARSTESNTSHADLLLQETLVARLSLMEEDGEAVLMGAHSLMDVCKGLFIGLRLRRERRKHVREVLKSFEMYGRLNKLMEMELSLMYDILYTKAVVIHTWYGFFIRVVSLVATASALLLFQLNLSLSNSNLDKLRKVDVAVSYVLLGGALLLEVASVVRAAASTWTSALLYDKKWHWLNDELLSLRRLARAARHRKWSGYLGQYNLLDSCARDASCRKQEPTCVAAARRLGLGRTAEYWWDNLRNSTSNKLSDAAMEMVLAEILLIRTGNRGEEITGLLPGMLTLQRLKLDDRLSWSIQDIEFEDSIMVWHLATHICIFSAADRNKDDDDHKFSDLEEAVMMLSNYMMFLLVLRPYMLPGPVRRSRYVQFRDDLRDVMRGSPSPPQERLDWALRKGLHAHTNSSGSCKLYHTGVTLAHVLHHGTIGMKVIFGVWVEMLCYVANHCSRESHAKQLSNGGELVTIVWLMARHANLSYASS